MNEGDGRGEVEVKRGASKDMTEHGATDHSRSTRALALRLTAD